MTRRTPKKAQPEPLAKVIPLITPLTVHGPPVEFRPDCPDCDYDRHRCPGCGTWTYHGTTVCLKCDYLGRKG